MIKFKTPIPKIEFKVISPLHNRGLVNSIEEYLQELKVNKKIVMFNTTIIDNECIFKVIFYPFEFRCSKKTVDDNLKQLQKIHYNLIFQGSDDYANCIYHDDDSKTINFIIRPTINGLKVTSATQKKVYTTTDDDLKEFQNLIDSMAINFMRIIRHQFDEI